MSGDVADHGGRVAAFGVQVGVGVVFGIWVFNEQFADLGDLFNVGDLNERLAGLATVLVPAR